MAERTERTVINHLIDTCRDAERGFRIAAGEVKNAELKRLLLRLAEQRHDFAEELLPHAYRLGGANASDGSSMGAMHRAWMQVRARFASDTDHAVLSEAARGERFALAAYEDAVHDVLAPETREVLEAHELGIRIADRLVTESAVQ
jgi:uncharacterized protein (TIGR02284 family)